MFITLNHVKDAVTNGKTVYYCDDTRQVNQDDTGDFYVDTGEETVPLDDLAGEEGLFFA